MLITEKNYRKVPNRDVLSYIPSEIEDMRVEESTTMSAEDMAAKLITNKMFVRETEHDTVEELLANYSEDDIKEYYDEVFVN